MDKPFNTRPLREARDALGCPHMQGLKCLRSAFDIEADGIHHAIGSGDCRFNRVVVFDIGTYRLKPESLRAVGMPRRDPGREALTAKMAHNAPSEKSGSSKHRHDSIGHRTDPP
jgi:hypothetical protein